MRAVGHCGECHTPRSALTMAVDGSRLLAGNSKRTGPEGQMAPNITPDRATGVGEWSEEQIAAYLATGNQPDGDVAGGLMGGNIQGTLAGYKDLTTRPTGGPSRATSRASRRSGTRSTSGPVSISRR